MKAGTSKQYKNKGAATVAMNAMAKKTGMEYVILPVYFDEVTGAPGNFYKFFVAPVEAKPAKARKEKEYVSASFPLSKQDDKYLHVVVGDSTFKVAKSRVNFTVNDDMVRMEMTAKYASHRPELNVTVQ